MVKFVLYCWHVSLRTQSQDQTETTLSFLHITWWIRTFPRDLLLQKLFPRFPATFSGITGLSPISSLFLNGKITHHYRHIQSTDFYFQVLLLWNYFPDSLVRVFLLFHDYKVSFIPFVPLINYYVSTLYPLFHCRLVATLLVIIYNYDNNNNNNNNYNENNNSNN